MHKFGFAAFLLLGTALPAFALDVAAAPATGPVIIAPATTPLAQTIKADLGAAYAAASKDSPAYRERQQLYFLYGARHFEPIWLQTGADGRSSFSQAAQPILQLFRAAGTEGLRPQDYLTPDLDPAAAGSDPAKLAALETAFSGAVLRYATHLYTGRILPRSVDPLLDVDPKTLDGAALLTELSQTKDPAKVLAALDPVHPEFVALKRALAALDGGADNRPQPIPAGPTLKPGMIDGRVAALRTRFKLPADPSTLYDDNLVAAVTAFQSGLGLEPDGAIGPATLAALNEGAAVSREDILANMERWRWMPRELGAFNVFVNIPEFRLAINRDGKEEYTTRVVVGTVKNQTPIFSDTIRHIVVNPYWNVPSSIVADEIGPKTRANPGYVDAQNMDLIYQGTVVSPWQVNWAVVGDSFPFKVRQRPGPGNALGQIKFLFPNKHDVYLHDTPSKTLFGNTVRAYSHGCVRVQNPMEFAGALLANEPTLNRASLEAMFGPNERWVNPEHNIPVHLAYFTLRVSPEGTVKSFGDVYGHHAKLIAAMAN